MEHPHLAPIVCALLRSIGASSTPIEPVESFSNAVWLTAEHAVHYHVVGPAGRLEHEARVAGRLPASALYPAVVAAGRDSEHDWLITKRVPGVPLSAAWPWLSRQERREAIFQMAGALRAIHRAQVTDLVPPCLQGGVLTLSRRALIGRLMAAGIHGISSLADAVDEDSYGMAHGDFSFNQVMWFEGHVTALLDLEMSHAEAPDWDLSSFLAFCADPVRMVPQAIEKDSTPEDYRDAPGWLREAYPAMFDHPRQRDRLLLHSLVFRATELLNHPSRFEEIISASMEEVNAIESLLPR